MGGDEGRVGGREVEKSKRNGGREAEKGKGGRQRREGTKKGGRGGRERRREAGKGRGMEGWRGQGRIGRGSSGLSQLQEKVRDHCLCRGGAPGLRVCDLVSLSLSILLSASSFSSSSLNLSFSSETPSLSYMRSLFISLSLDPDSYFFPAPSFLPRFPLVSVALTSIYRLPRLSQ